MSSADFALIMTGVMLLAGGIGIRQVLGSLLRDRMFDDVAPGVIPPNPETAATIPVPKGQEYRGEIPVAFIPPRDVAPGLAEVLITGSATHRGVLATLIDLARRGHLDISLLPHEAPDEKSSERPPADWEIRRISPSDRTDTPRYYEQLLMDRLFPDADSVVRLSALASEHRDTLRTVGSAMCTEAARIGWYGRNPEKRSSGCLPLAIKLGGLALPLLTLFSVLVGPGSVVGLIGIPLSLAGAGLAWSVGHARVARTAMGTAVTVQTLGFKDYLATVEADQIAFEEVCDLFGRYLPHAMVFGLAERWTALCGQVARRASSARIPQQVATADWLSGMVSTDTDGSMLELLSGADFVENASTLWAGFSTMADAVGDTVLGMDP